MPVPDSLRLPTDTTYFFQDFALNLKTGYKDKNSTFESNFTYYDDLRGQGTKIKLKNGSTTQFDTYRTNLKYRHSWKNLSWQTIIFYQRENYQKEIEKEKKDVYTLIDVNSVRQDYGIITFSEYNLRNIILSYGFDLKKGEVDGNDTYKTSTDVVKNNGSLLNSNLYLQNDMKLGRFTTIANINFSFYEFQGGQFKILNPTAATSFMLQDTATLNSSTDFNISPRISAQYNLTQDISLYAIISTGYRTPTLDDLTRSGFVNIGYKIANPDLKPETIKNFEGGIKFSKNKLEIRISAYYSIGENFMHYIFTGKTIFGGRKKVYQKQNITEVKIKGIEVNGKININNNLSIETNYTYNQARINKFDSVPEIEGNLLPFSPLNTIKIITLYRTGKLEICPTLSYYDIMYTDEENTNPVNNFVDAGIKAGVYFFKNLKLYVSVSNIFNRQYFVNPYELSIGRFAKLGLKYNF